jgi:hypothetical protein
MKKFQACIWVSAFFVLFTLKKDLVWEPPLNKGSFLKNTTHPAEVTPPPTPPPVKPTLAPVSPPPLANPQPTAKPISINNTSRPIPAIPATSASSEKNIPVVTYPPQSPIPPSSFTISQPQISNEDLTEKAQQFVEQHCDLNPLKGWYPEKHDSWQERAPYFILAGVWNSGVTTLSQALQLHPQITTNPKNGFFLPKNFYKFRLGKGKKNKIKVFAARKKMYAQGYQTKTLIANQKQVAMDVSPGYLFYASQTAYSILCTSPSSKVVVMLRNPVDRVYRQWIYGRANLGLKLSLEDWMAQEMKLMQSVGLTTTAENPAAEQEAWKNYQSVRSMSGAIGRSLYVLQLQEWFQALREAGKDPTKEMYIVPSEFWEQQPHLEYDKLVQFLGLVEHHPRNLVTSNKKAAAGNLPPMKNETRQMLEEFFAPYNERLSDLLGNDFGGYWKDKNIWKQTSIEMNKF